MSKKTSYYFIGGVFPGNMERFIVQNSKKNIQSAANAFQLNIINGLLENFKTNDDINFKILNTPFIGSYPFFFKKIKMPKLDYKINSYEDQSIGFNNIFLYKNIEKSYRIKNMLEKQLKEDTSNSKNVIIYSIHSPFLTAVTELKEEYKLNICLIVPDLPEYMNLGRKEGSLKKILKKIDRKVIDKAIERVDSYVLLTKYMLERLPKKPYRIIEGIASNEVIDIKKVAQEDEVILYTGTLDSKYGILNFVYAFLQLERPNLKLKIYGYGDTVEELRRIAVKYPDKISYEGIAEHKVILKEQKSATYLINPRPSGEEYTKYSFPSKIMEYLKTGVPTIATKLDGIPEEYYPYLNFISEESQDDYLNSIKKILDTNYSDLLDKSEKGKIFIEKNKNPKEQTKKIIEVFIE